MLCKFHELRFVNPHLRCKDIGKYFAGSFTTLHSRGLYIVENVVFLAHFYIIRHIISTITISSQISQFSRPEQGERSFCRRNGAVPRGAGVAVAPVCVASRIQSTGSPHTALFSSWPRSESSPSHGRCTVSLTLCYRDLPYLPLSHISLIRVIFFSSSLREPCPGCVAPYGYHNLMPLSTDANLFSVSVASNEALLLLLFGVSFFNVIPP